ncbi:MAG TPA: hypothetical protein VF307_06380 [Candidatus Nanopelagicaceae bacterium]
MTTQSPESENFVEDVKDDLIRIDHLPVSERSEQFDRLHHKLEGALSTIDGL